MRLNSVGGMVVAAAHGRRGRVRVGASLLPVFEFEYSNRNLIPAQWILEIHPDGSGHFRSQHGNAAPTEDIEPPDIDRDFQVSAPFAQHVFQVAERKRLFHAGCESHMKVAFRGPRSLCTRVRPGRVRASSIIRKTTKSRDWRIR